MKKLLFVSLMLPATLTFAGEVTIVKVASYARGSGYLYGDTYEVEAAARSKSEAACSDLGGTVEKTICDVSIQDIHLPEVWSRAAGCATTCKTP